GLRACSPKVPGRLRPPGPPVRGGPLCTGGGAGPAEDSSDLPRGQHAALEGPARQRGADAIVVRNVEDVTIGNQPPTRRHAPRADWRRSAGRRAVTVPRLRALRTSVSMPRAPRGASRRSVGGWFGRAGLHPGPRSSTRTRRPRSARSAAITAPPSRALATMMWGLGTDLLRRARPWRARRPDTNKRHAPTPLGLESPSSTRALNT